MTTTFNNINSDDSTDNSEADKQTLINGLTDFETVESYADGYEISTEWSSLTTADMRNIREAGFYVDTIVMDDYVYVRKHEENDEEPEPTVVDEIREVVDTTYVNVVDKRDECERISLRISKERSVLLNSVERNKIENLGWEIKFIGGVNQNNLHVYLREIESEDDE